jgi:putative transcription antitermination factor YqgF
MGLAIGDDISGVASPLRIVPYAGVAAAAELIRTVAEELAAELVVVGLPTDADGRRTPACARSEALAASLIRLGMPVELQSEFLTTNEARRRARALGLAARAPVDHLAAQVLLEEFLAARGGTRG